MDILKFRLNKDDYYQNEPLDVELILENISPFNLSNIQIGLKINHQILADPQFNISTQDDSYDRDSTTFNIPIMLPFQSQSIHFFLTLSTLGDLFFSCNTIFQSQTDFNIQNETFLYEKPIRCLFPIIIDFTNNKNNLLDGKSLIYYTITNISPHDIKIDDVIVDSRQNEADPKFLPLNLCTILIVIFSGSFEKASSFLSYPFEDKVDPKINAQRSVLASFNCNAHGIIDVSISILVIVNIFRKII
ncbi:hypothetical protein HZS_6165 [Henneguya salminicola]|nr:hypothetical protein HZS_6165 [Henneguya salminicola]